MNRMNNRTPRLATLALMLAALTACTKTNITPNDDLTNALNPSSGAPIAFETEDAFTKAVIDDINDLQVEGNKFRVWGHFQGTTSGPMFTEIGTEVEYKKLNEESIPQYGWTYNPTRYWLNGTYDFAAVYPATIPVEVNGEISQKPISGTYAPAEGGTTPVLTVKDFDVTNQDDLLVAFNTGIDGGNHPSSVELNFEHALTMVNFRVSQDFNKDPDNDYYITRAVFNGVKNKMTYSSLNGWDQESAKETKLFERSFNPAIRLREHPDGFYLWDESLMLIPQDIDFETMSLTLEYRYDMRGESDGNGSGTYLTRYIPASTDIWPSGKKITYVINLSEETNITFGQPNITPWGDNPLVGGTIIIQ